MINQLVLALLSGAAGALSASFVLWRLTKRRPKGTTIDYKQLHHAYFDAGVSPRFEPTREMVNNTLRLEPKFRSNGPKRTNGRVSNPPMLKWL